jgi:HTH-type transcriptional regulator/antitoxin HigA
MLKMITTEDQYNEIMARVYDLMQAEIKAGSPESHELASMVILVKDYETEHYPIPFSKTY